MGEGKKRKIILKLFVSFVFNLIPGSAVQANIFDEMRRARSHWQEEGIAFDMLYTGDSVSTVSGGIKNGTAFLGNLDLIMTIDTQKLALWDQGTFLMYGIYNHGSSRPTEKFVGDLQGVDNIETARTFRLFELWYEQRLFTEKLSILLGLRDINADFYASEYAGVLMNSSFGIGPEITANTKASVFPITSPGVRFKWQPNQTMELLTGVFHGDPRDHDTNEKGTHIAFNKKHGVMTLTEVGLHYPFPSWQRGDPLPGTLKVGAWHHDKDVDDVFATDDTGAKVRHDDNYGTYSLLDQMVYREKDKQGLGVFFQYGQVPDDRNTVDVYLGSGLHYQGLIPGRDEDIAGVGLAYASISEELRLAEAKDQAEKTIEATYRAKMSEKLALQMDVQFVFDPGANPSLEDAVVAILRFEVGL